VIFSISLDVNVSAAVKLTPLGMENEIQLRVAEELPGVLNE
jgi:hypothetical protein